MAQTKWLEVLGWSKGEVDDLRFVAYSYIKQGVYDVALTLFDAIQVLSPPNAYDLQTLGALYLQLGNAQRSLFFLDQALALNPNHRASELNKAKALLMLGRTQEAFFIARKLQQSDISEISAQATALLYTQSHL